ncbi:serine/threonine-protein kinase [Actinoplanes sp. NPDC048988]|uniref:serine/threonine-protein kinase n=1 Tax=Actinoplanes sp. NPDC048988 TaxID=3363901 RepID=UPI00371C2CA4
MNGQLLGGRYRLLTPIGSGGMAVVWRAHDDVLARTVAVKVLAPSQVGDPDSRERIRHEARAAAALSHPNVAQVHDYGEMTNKEQVFPYVVMELVPGGTLLRRLCEGPVAPRFAMRTGAEIAAALAAAHAENLVHCDIKPANVMLAPTGAKVVDFGIAAATSPGTPGAVSDEVLGTPAYLAPERLLADVVEPASDMYALGVVLYRLLSGRSPWTTNEPTQLLKQHIHLDPKPLSMLPGVPGYVAELTNRCLAKSPSARPTAREAATLLARGAGLRVVTDERLPSPTPVEPPPEPSVLIPTARHHHRPPHPAPPSTPPAAAPAAPSNTHAHAATTHAHAAATHAHAAATTHVHAAAAPPHPATAPAHPATAPAHPATAPAYLATGLTHPAAGPTKRDATAAGPAKRDATAAGPAKRDATAAHMATAAATPANGGGAAAQPGQAPEQPGHAAPPGSDRAPAEAARARRRAAGRWAAVGALATSAAVGAWFMLPDDNVKPAESAPLPPTAPPSAPASATAAPATPGGGAARTSARARAVVTAKPSATAPSPGSSSTPTGSAAPSSPATATTTAPAPAPGTPSAEPTAAPPAAKTFSSAAGTIEATCTAPATAKITFWQATKPYKVLSAAGGPSRAPAVTYKQGKSLVTMTVTCAGGVPSVALSETAGGA